MTVAAVLTAAGLGTRLGADVPKALVNVAGRPLVAWALDRLAASAAIVVITAPAGHADEFEAVLAAAQLAHPRTDITVVEGAGTRQESVAAGVKALAGRAVQPTVIAIHDAARAFMPAEAIDEAIAAVRAGADGAVPVVPVVDTLVAAPGADGALGDGIDRSALRAVQTPQVFAADVAVDVHRRAADDGFTGTDDATLARHYGYRVVATAGHSWGFKVTTPGDLALAEHVARSS